MAQTKGTKKTGGKTGKSSSSAAKKTAKKNPKNTKGAKQVPVTPGRNPVYVLVIMVLAIVIILLINNLYNKNRIKVSNKVPDKKSSVLTKEDVNTVKNEVTKEEKKTEKTADKSARDKDDRAVDTEYVKVYFIRLNERTEKIYLSTVKRKVSNKSTLQGAIRELVKGPTASEKKKGLLTAIPGNVRVNSISIRNRSAVIDFNSAIERGAAGNILLSRIDQVVYTATQFKGVDTVIIKINGSMRKTLGSDGLSIGGPLHRRR